MSTEAESSPTTRPSLLARLKDWGQESAWREFDHDYAPLVRNVARKAGLTGTEADEVAQETLIAVARKIGEFQHAGNRGSFRAWLYQQKRWRIADQFRARARTAGPPRLQSHPAQEPGRNQAGANSEAGTGAGSSPPIRLESAEAEPPAAESDPGFELLWSAEWEEHLRQSALALVKRTVGARQFQLFELHVLQGLDVRAAAKAAGATRAAVYMAKSRVGRQVRREITRLRAVE